MTASGPYVDMPVDLQCARNSMRARTPGRSVQLAGAALLPSHREAGSTDLGLRAGQLGAVEEVSWERVDIAEEL